MSRLRLGIVRCLLASAVGLACSDREVGPNEPDRIALCAGQCAQIFSPCNPDPPSNFPDGPQTEEECNAGCVDAPLWTHACRFEYAAQLKCNADLDCDEFAAAQLDGMASPCADEAFAVSNCIP